MPANKLINITEQRSIVIWIKPLPGRKSLIIVLTVKFKTLDIFLHYIFKFMGTRSVLNIEATAIVALYSLYNFAILDLEFLELAVLRLLSVLLLIVENCSITFGFRCVVMLRTRSTSIFHLTYHIRFKSLGKLQ